MSQFWTGRFYILMSTKKRCMEGDMKELITPFGTVWVMIDDEFVEFELIEIETEPGSMDGCFLIKAFCMPDGSMHRVSCCFSPVPGLEKYGESGERYLTAVFYDNKKDTQLTIGLVANDIYYDENGKQYGYESYDFSTNFTETESIYISYYQTMPYTKTSHFAFGIAWVTKNAKDRESPFFYAEPCYKDFY